MKQVQLLIITLTTILLLSGCASSVISEDRLYTFTNQSSYTVKVKTRDKNFDSILITLQPQEFYLNSFKYPIRSYDTIPYSVYDQNENVGVVRDHSTRTITFIDVEKPLVDKYEYIFKNSSSHTLSVNTYNEDPTIIPPNTSAIIRKKFSITSASQKLYFSFKTENDKVIHEANNDSDEVIFERDHDTRTITFFDTKDSLSYKYNYMFRNDSDYEVTVDSTDGDITSLLPGESALIKQKYPVTKYSNPFSYSSESGRVGLMKDIDAKTMIFINSDKPPFVEEALSDKYSYVFRNNSNYTVTVDSGEGNITSLLPGESALIKQNHTIGNGSTTFYFSYSFKSGKVGLIKDIDAKTMIFINAYNPTIDVEDLASNQVLFKNKSDYPLTIHIAGDDNSIPLNSGDSFLFDIPSRYTFGSLDYIFKEVKGRVGSLKDSKNKTISFINSDKPPFVEEALLDKYSYVFSNDSSYVIKIDSGNGNITSLLPGDSALIKQKYTIDKWTSLLPFSYTEYDGKVVQNQDLDMKIFTFSDNPRSTPSAIFVNNTDYTLKVSLKSVKKTIEVPKGETYEVYYTSPLYNGINYYPTSFGSHAFKSSVSGNTVTFNQWIPEVEYRITGTAKSVDVTLSNENGETSQYRNITLPYSFAYSNFHDKKLHVSAQNRGDYGSVVVAIYIDGIFYKIVSSSGAFTTSSVSGWK